MIRWYSWYFMERSRWDAVYWTVYPNRIKCCKWKCELKSGVCINCASAWYLGRVFGKQYLVTHILSLWAAGFSVSIETKFMDTFDRCMREWYSMSDPEELRPLHVEQLWKSPFTLWQLSMPWPDVSVSPAVYVIGGFLSFSHSSCLWFYGLLQIHFTLHTCTVVNMSLWKYNNTCACQNFLQFLQ